MAGASEAAGSDDGPPPDPCIGKVCNTPPSQDCSSSTKLKTYDSIGSCAAGECSYASHDIACTCVSQSCTTDPCVNVTCATPPAPICKDTNTLTSYAAAGTCASGSCSYAPSDKACAFGCANGACNPDPCSGVICNTQPPATCKSVSTKTSYASSGTCGGAAKCSYAATDSACGSNTTCAGAGVCSVCAADTSCGASCTACGSSAPKCKNLGTTSQCVQCVTNADCTSSASPVCNLVTNTCVARPSCVGLSATCGVNGSVDCCAAGAVPGGTFYLNYDGVSANATSTAYPATVSSFKLDNYEITVGRFRKFVAAYSQTMIPAGAGKNPNNPSDPGWDTANNAHLEATAAALAASVKGASYRTYNDTPGTALEESRPVNYLGYYEAAAFCIWDGGRLPTEAEWDYAAAGGPEQRVYAWGNSTPGPNTLLANWGCYFNATGTCGDVTNISRVGSIPAGNGKWGQSDLTGNVFEFVSDRLGGPPSPCTDCEQLTGPYDPGIVRGGCFYETMTSNLVNSLRGVIGVTGTTFSGARCAL